MNNVYLLEGARTAFGSLGGGLAGHTSTELGTIAAKAALEKAGMSPGNIESVVFGNVIHSHTNAAYLARHIGLEAGVPQEVPALTVNRLCGSGLEAVVQTAKDIMFGDSGLAVAGGSENMSMSPHANFKVRSKGAKFGAVTYEDMLLSTLTDERAGCGMGITAENLAQKYEITRAEQDEFAAESHRRGHQAQTSGRFAEEITPVPGKKGDVTVDEHVRPGTTPEKLAALKPSFRKDGTVTAGNASGINDGAAAVILAGERAVEEYGARPLARVISWGTAGVDPAYMGIGPVPAIQKALKMAGLGIKDIDLFEVNEAFSAQYLAVEKELGLDREKTNVNGGAVALGHPVGASGTRLLLTLMYELKKRSLRYGCASLCIGGGQGIAMIVENKQL